MREVIAICRSRKRSRRQVATVLDRYFWRIGDRTWRGQASNACLDRMSRELRKKATRSTAVSVHEIRSANESRVPIIRIGSKLAFSDEGLAPVATRPARTAHWNQQSSLSSLRSVVRIAALFHDLGKATNLFNNKLLSALRGARPQADAIRHELFSAAVWNKLTQDIDDESLITTLRDLKPEIIDLTCRNVVRELQAWHANPEEHSILQSLTDKPDSLSSQIGLLILSHHRLPDSNQNFSAIRPTAHINRDATLAINDLTIAPGTPFWHEQWWLDSLQREVDNLKPGMNGQWQELSMRASLMFADHVGSARKKPAKVCPKHLANTVELKDSKKSVAADSLSLHTKRVYKGVQGAFEMLHNHRASYPAIDEDKIPIDLIAPYTESPRFQWQVAASSAARTLCHGEEGGFFCCIVAATGTGKTRGAPTILANAVFGDKIPERRSFRMTLGLGLRVLAKQSGDEYVRDLGFSSNDVSVVVGEQPIGFVDEDMSNWDGSESHFELPEWMRVEIAGAHIPDVGSEHEADWLRGLSLNTDHRLPMFCDLAIKHSNRSRSGAFKRLVASPILVGTIDHLMAVAAPLRSHFLPQAIRMVSSDLILDEIDQYSPEDLAVLNRLVFQTGAAGRRVILMSATLTEDIAEAFFASYKAGWRNYANAFNVKDQVNVLCTGDDPASVFVKTRAEDIKSTLSNCRKCILKSLKIAPALRKGKILPVCDSWSTLVDQIDNSCRELHEAHATTIGEIKISVGLVRMTRIAHTTALAVQLPAGVQGNRLRLKLCLHSNFPRLHRAWIESILKNTLTRKGKNPNLGLEALCQRFNLLHQAAKAGVKEIEIVVISSPVIETGNDLDFDWAVIDPVSSRSVVQSSGRTQRHRDEVPTQVNIHILGCSAIVLETGLLAMPGVETKPHQATRVQAQELNNCISRNTVDLFGDENLSIVNAGFILEQIGNVPLRDAETRLREAMISVSSVGSAPRMYLASTFGRLNSELERQRRFRRSVTRDIELLQDGENEDNAQWFLDLAPGTRESERRLAEDHGLTITPDESFSNFLTENFTAQAWNDMVKVEKDMGSAELKLLMRARLPDYSRADGELAVPILFYSEHTGFTRGTREDLFCEFGKN